MAIAIDLSDETALVTGAGAGIGREVGLWLARAGAQVTINDLIPERAESVAQEIRDEGGIAHAVAADCRDDAAVDHLIMESFNLMNGLSIAINNVGMLPPSRGLKPFIEYRGDDWRDIIDQNLTLSALCGRAEAELMVKNGGGVIMFVTSGESTRPSPYNSAYAASKAAINHLVSSMAVELGPSGIRVVAIAPGTTLTETVAAAFTEERVEQIVASTPLRKMVEHDELGRLATFLASDLARCITGQFLIADAGAFLSRTRPGNLQGIRKSDSTEGTK